jgi:hypothetical protein
MTDFVNLRDDALHFFGDKIFDICQFLTDIILRANNGDLPPFFFSEPFKDYDSWAGWRRVMKRAAHGMPKKQKNPIVSIGLPVNLYYLI